MPVTHYTEVLPRVMRIRSLAGSIQIYGGVIRDAMPAAIPAAIAAGIAADNRRYCPGHSEVGLLPRSIPP
jgi:hypothetical protein